MNDEDEAMGVPTSPPGPAEDDSVEATSMETTPPTDLVVSEGPQEQVTAFEQLDLPMPVGMAGMVMVGRSTSMTGPLPPPAILADFERAIPGTGKQIVKWADTEGKHRREREIAEFDLAAYSVHAQLDYQKLGMYFGLIVALAGLAATCFLAVYGAPIAAGVVGTVDLLGLVGIFVYGRSKQAEVEMDRQAQARRTTRPKPTRANLPSAASPKKNKTTG